LPVFVNLLRTAGQAGGQRLHGSRALARRRERAGDWRSARLCIGSRKTDRHVPGLRSGETDQSTETV